MHPRFHAREKPDKPAVIRAETGEALSYATLEARANQGAHLLRALGIHNGDTIAIWLPNCLAYYEIYWAAQRAGVYITPLSTALTATEAGYILADSGSKLLFTSARVKSAAALLQQRRELAPGLVHVLMADQKLEDFDNWESRIV